MLSPNRLTAVRSVGIAVLLACALAGCSAGDVQLNGKVFDMLGAATGANAETKDVKLAARPGLVAPPTTQSLPEPGTNIVPDGELATIVDHDRKKIVDRSALEKQQAEYCKVNYEQAKQRGDSTADAATGPLGPCRASALGMIKSINGQ
jgi:hypothetical protein